MKLLHLETIQFINRDPDRQRALCHRLEGAVAYLVAEGVEETHILETQLDAMAREFAERPNQPAL